MSSSEIYIELGVALGLGLLVGLQRQHAGSQMGGIRTFPLITLLGAVSALLARSYGGWVMAAGMIGMAALAVVSNLFRGDSPEQRRTRGMTTEAAALLMYLVGAAVTSDYLAPAVAVAGATAVLLQWKAPLHQLVNRLGERDTYAIFQFVLISMVILPVLPDKAYGPLGVLNPRTIWMMVVLIVGMSLVGYVIYKFVGARTGALLGGVLGGMISSTATTVSYSRRTAESAEAGGLAAAVITIASAIAFVRVLFEIAVVAPSALLQLAPPLVAMFVLMILISVVCFWRFRHEKAEFTPPQNPTELKAALVFAALYAVVIFTVAAVKNWVGPTGLYVVAVLSGLTDMDAITLSTAELVHSGELGSTTGWRMILIASLSNLVFKFGVVAMLGERRLAGRIGMLFGAAMLGGVAILLFWPADWPPAGAVP